MNIPIVGTDINPQAPALDLADHAIIASSRDPQQSLHAIKAFAAKHRIRGVLTLANDCVDTVSALCHHFNLPGPSPDTAKRCADKLTQLKYLRHAGVKVPRTISIHSAEQLQQLIKHRTKPVIIKPTDGRGARGVMLINRDMDARAAYRHCRGQTRQPIILMQDFIEGRQISAEGFVINGKAHTALYSDRNYELLQQLAPFVIENGGNLPASLSAEENAALDDVVQRAAEALDICNGPIKGDLVISKKGIYALEFTARLGGGYASSHSIPLVNDIDLLKLNIQFAMHQPLDTQALTPHFKQYAALRFFFPKPGRITAIYGYKELSEKPWVKLRCLYYEVGDQISNYAHHANRAGCVIVVGGSREQTEQRAKEAVENVRILTA